MGIRMIKIKYKIGKKCLKTKKFTIYLHIKTYVWFDCANMAIEIGSIMLVITKVKKKHAPKNCLIN